MRGGGCLKPAVRSDVSWAAERLLRTAVAMASSSTRWVEGGGDSGQKVQESVRTLL